MLAKICRRASPLIQSRFVSSRRFIIFQVELRDGRVGKLNVRDQDEFDKILQKTGALGFTSQADADEETVDVVTRFERIVENQTYSPVYMQDMVDEMDHFDDYGEEADVEEMDDEEEPEEEYVEPQKNYKKTKNFNKRQ